MKTTLYAGEEALVLDYTQSGDLYEFTLNEQTGQVQLISVRNGAVTFLVDGQAVQAHVATHGARILVAIEGRVYEFSRAQDSHSRKRKSQTGGWEPEIRSPMPGKILEVRVGQGDEVESNQTLLVLEAMKMENALASEGKARVKTIHVAPGELVELGQVLIELEPLESPA
jgi:biotin carboxyl carrier protein